MSKRKVYLFHSILQKLEKIHYVDDHPKLSHSQLASHFSLKFKLKHALGRSTVAQIIKNRATYENEENLNQN